MGRFGEGQFNIDFGPTSPPPEAGKVPKAEMEMEMERRKEEALALIKKIYPHEDIDDLHVIPPEEIEGNDPSTILLRRPLDSDKGKTEMFFRVVFEEGRAVGVGNPTPEKQPFHKLLERGAKRRYH